MLPWLEWYAALSGLLHGLLALLLIRLGTVAALIACVILRGFELRWKTAPVSRP